MNACPAMIPCFMSSDPPLFDLDVADFARDPYPALAEMRALAPIVRVPALGAVLLTRHQDISTQEKRVEVFSSVQPGGLMTVLMGENMMRKDGDAHAAERRATFPAFSPRTVRDVWLGQFKAATEAILEGLKERKTVDLVRDYAMPVSGEALRSITGLTNLSATEMDTVSQAMMDGIANYQGDAAVEARCHAGTAKIEAAIDQRLEPLRAKPDHSLLSVQLAANLPMETIRANVKLAISGGQNEPRDAIAGTVWALLTHPQQLALVQSGEATWKQAFEEYARWISPIGMSPRQIARPDVVHGLSLAEGDRAFLMFGSGNRDSSVFDEADAFRVTRDCSKSLSFGAGPHFCAGAWASRALIAEVALPMLFATFPDLKLAGETPFGGWAFRGPVKMPVSLG